VRVLRISETAGAIDLRDALLPYRDARDKGPFDVIPASAFCLTRLRQPAAPDPLALGNHLMVVLSGEVCVQAEQAGLATLGPGDVVGVAVRTAGAITYAWEGDAWLFIVRTPGWLPAPGDNQARHHAAARTGRPLLNWIRDDNGVSRSEPLRWPGSLASMPPPARWPRSKGAFVTRRDYGDGAYAPGKWHNGPRPQLGITLNGCAENETGDGTITRPVAGDIAFIDDDTGAGHITRGQGDRWMLFVTVAPGHLELTPES
jgi:quercetin dioxygenase-like cupin family protein